MAKKPSKTAKPGYQTEIHAYNWRTRNNLKPSKPMTVTVKKSGKAC